MADGAMRYLGRRINNDQQQGGRGAVAWIVHRRRLLLDSGRAMMLLGAIVLTSRQLIITTSSGATHSVDAELYHAYDVVLVAFLLWLLGVALATLSLVAPRAQLPGLAFANAAVAMALRNHILRDL
ncbi:Os06g0600000 [Oryza sativa Japonica Group]|uniref:Uncharacterized protein n=3 Tax=Oryza TaxID=4527 RepID=A0A0P0WYL4_ORYSJ|nr:hypothetical protein OsJ_21882 [Oryza sativa Japonica Group]KAF2927428.1 hypothetical protein DAI22_06g204800 [Oryza sativa Japonica Group]BAD32832.1 hypothetical protein [Oryza sativa Japonica Group]BAD32953.1 hypothetical protein [Oryza sativa Japonica Group]BAS98487.1 Os06g0600000 [Oryza sativa Japonica Group]